MVWVVEWVIGSFLVVGGFLATIDGTCGALERINAWMLKLAYRIARMEPQAYRIRYRHNPVDNHRVQGKEPLI